MPRHPVNHRVQGCNVAVGAVDPRRTRWRQTVVVLDHDMFGRIRASAIREGTSFTEQVRVLCEWGLEAAGEGGGDG